MAVICAACQTENRDAAMFCHGCARKLPAFAPTAPSLLETLRARDAAAAARPLPRLESLLRRAVREPLFPLGVALLVAALTVGWYAQATRAQAKAASVSSAASAAKPAVVAPASVAVTPVKPEPPRLAVPVPLVASLAPGEIELSPTLPATPAPPVASAVQTAPIAPIASARRSPPRVATSARPGALDPRHGCETLNFVFAAHCEAAHCEKPEYAGHPRCNVVREERRRDEARRNPTLGF
jgi:hypothetical protein